MNTQFTCTKTNSYYKLCYSNQIARKTSEKQAMTMEDL